MADIKANSLTGQIAVNRGGEWHIYEPGTFKINRQTGQIATIGPQGWDIHDSPDAVTKLSSPDAILAMQTGGVGGPGSSSQPGSNMGLGESALRGAGQGMTAGLSDEIGAEVTAGLTAANGGQVPADPAHPVTGGTTTGFGPAYQNAIIKERAENDQAKAANPKAYKSMKLGTGLLSAGMMPAARSVGQAAMQGAGLGGLLGFGNADTQDPASALKQTGISTAAGGLLSGATQAILGPVLADTTASGLAYRSLNESTPGGMLNIRSRPSSTPAELDPVMSDMLRSSGAMNGPAAAARIPAAQARMGDVNQAIVGQVNRSLSPDDAAAYLQQLQQNAQRTNQAAYQAAHADPTRVGLPPNVTERPSFQEALAAARARAADEYPPRNVDPTDLGALDIDLVDRSLQSAQRAATESHGDTSAAALAARARMDTRGEVAGDVRQVADAAFPQLQTARAGAAQSFAQERAIETGGQWLKSTTSPEQVAAEFAGMTAAEQQGALAAFATNVRNTLGTKTAHANLGNFFEKNAVAAKLQAVGVPEDIVQRIVQGGQGARDVLNALQGGSMTARNQAFKQGMKSTLTDVRAGDLTAGALLNSPAVTLALPLARAAGTRAGTNAAGMLTEALTTPGSAGLAGIYNRAPQTWGGLLSQPPAYAGGLLGGQLGAGFQ